MGSGSKVCFFFEKKDFTLENRGRLKVFIETIFNREKKKLTSLNYIFCSDKRLLEINRQFLSHDYYTDIISFEFSGAASAESEVYISVDRVRDNAKSMGVSFKSELHRVIFHGALHLCGYKDKSGHEKEEMRRGEDQYLALYFRST